MTIDFIDSCTGGSSVEVNNSDETKDLLEFVNTYLPQAAPHLDPQSFSRIIYEIVTALPEHFQYSTEDSSSGKCDQCGDYNTKETYKLTT